MIWDRSIFFIIKWLIRQQEFRHFCFASTKGNIMHTDIDLEIRRVIVINVYLAMFFLIFLFLLHSSLENWSRNILYTSFLRRLHRHAINILRRNSRRELVRPLQTVYLPGAVNVQDLYSNHGSFMNWSCVAFIVITLRWEKYVGWRSSF